MLPVSSLCAFCRRTYRLSPRPLFRRGAVKSSYTPTDVFMPATITKLDVADQAPLVTGYTTNGFTIRDMFVYGSVALLPRGFFNWKVTSVNDLTPECFTLFHLVQPRIDLVVMGTGSRIHRVDGSIVQYLKRKGISLEVQDTPNACATFNYLLEEGRPAGAVLIPPQHIPP